jgi:hypothetical protein
MGSAPGAPSPLLEPGLVVSAQVSDDPGQSAYQRQGDNDEVRQTQPIEPSMRREDHGHGEFCSQEHMHRVERTIRCAALRLLGGTLAMRLLSAYAAQ